MINKEEIRYTKEELLALSLIHQGIIKEMLKYLSDEVNDCSYSGDDEKLRTLKDVLEKFADVGLRHHATAHIEDKY